MEKKEKWLVGLAAGVAAAGVTYALWHKSKIPNSALVQPFDREKYLGLWNEVARLPNSVEKNLKNVTDEYSMNADGSIKVVTRAYDFDKNKPVEATGKARFTGMGNRGKMKVAYMLPIYLDYNVLSIDDGYKYALISGNSLNYLWIISRENTIPDDIREQFLAKATSLGFDISKLQWM